VTKRYLFVVPRYGEKVGGGAETLVREVAERLAARGDSIEVFTTCALDNRTWENVLPEGQTTENKVLVHRFKVDTRSLDIWVPLQIRISEGMLLTTDEQLQWLEHGVNSFALYAELKQRSHEFSACFFAPYLFGTTFFGSLVDPERSVLIPCLHDEHYAYVDVISSMFRLTRGCLFNAAPEMDLARGLYGHIKGGEVGMGFDPFPADYVSELSHFFEDSAPYVLYLGRKETGKNAQLLVDNFISCKEGLAEGAPGKNLKLVIVGGGSFSDLHRPHALERADIVDLAHVSERDKHRLVKHALVLCQPSTNESFSIVLMEAWLLGTPVLVHAGCPVTRAHAIESGGGLYFCDSAEFSAVLGQLLADDVSKASSLRARLSSGGAAYVRSKYDWAEVLRRFDRVVEEIFSEPAQVMPLS
jgi:glycosyltransferase involved in cell wall biosynthesis